MITNQRQYQVTQKAIRDFRRAIEQIENGQSDTRPEMKPIYRDAFDSQIEELQAQLKEYEDLRDGRVRELYLDSLFDLPSALIKARIASGLTQRELADRLGLKEQQIQRYESRLYEGVSFVRMLEVGEALGVQLQGHIVLSSATADIGA